MSKTLLYSTHCELCVDFIPIVSKLRNDIRIIAHPSRDSLAFMASLDVYITAYPVLVENNIYYYGKTKILKQLNISKTRYKLERILRWLTLFLKRR